MATIAAHTTVALTASPSKIAAAKPAPLGDATNVQKAPAMDVAMKEEALRIVRKHTKFDEDGNPCQTVETEIEAPAAEEAPAEEEEVAADEATEVVAGEEATEEAAEYAAEDGDGEDAAAKMAYRSVPSFFNTEKERSAKFEGTHTRFPEDDEGEDDTSAAPVSEEMQAKIDDLSSAVSTAMVVQK
jgi:hypothetical protein